MLIALLVVLGVNLVVVVVFAVIMLGRRRWLKRQPGEFTGAIRVSNGQVHGLSPDWKHGSGRWVRDVLVWSKAPFLFRNELVPVDSLVGERQPQGKEVRRLGDKPFIVEFASDDVAIEVAAKAEDRDRVTRRPTAPTHAPSTAQSI
jgi:Protein of unknown function (DUF2550)